MSYISYMLLGNIFDTNKSIFETTATGHLVDWQQKRCRWGGGGRNLKISTVTITRRMLLSSTDFDIFDCGMIVGVGPPTTYQFQRHNAKSFTFLPFQILYPTVLGLSNLLKMSSTQILCDEARKALKWLWSRSRSRQKQRRQHLLSTFGALKTFIWKLTAH